MGVLKLSAVTMGHLQEEQNKALPKSLSPRPELEVSPGDVLITRGSGVTQFVGVSVYVNETRAKLMICDLIFRVVFRAASKVDPEFLTEVLRIRSVRRQIENGRTGAAPMLQKVTKSVLMGLSFPLPELGTQVAMVAALGEARALAIRNRQRAGELRSKAKLQFEAEVFAAETSDAEPICVAVTSVRKPKQLLGVCGVLPPGYAPLTPGPAVCI
jgi:type I restriction enzyme S subunit